jgi:hypothetical protein
VETSAEWGVAAERKSPRRALHDWAEYSRALSVRKYVRNTFRGTTRHDSHDTFGWFRV